jgi:hypothetical protein
MQKASELHVETLHPKTLVMGAPLIGKSTFAGTWPRPTYFFDFDGNMLTLAGRPGIYYDTFVDGDLKKPCAWANAMKTLDMFHKAAQDNGGRVVVDGVELDHVCVDSGSALVDACMAQVLAVKGRAGQAPQVGSQSDNDYTSANNLFGNFVRSLLALPCAVTLNCHEAFDKGETESVKRVYPDLIGKMSTKISSKFGLVLRLCVMVDAKTKEEKHVVLTQSQGMFYAGSRVNCFEIYEEANWPTLLGKMSQAIEAKK